MGIIVKIQGGLNIVSAVGAVDFAFTRIYMTLKTRMTSLCHVV